MSFRCILLAMALATSQQQQVLDRIYEGDISRKGQFPSLVRMYVDGREIKPVCTGSIVKSNLVLTAGHCCKVSGQLFVVFGEPDHYRYYKQVVKTGNITVPGYFSYPVARTHIHPSYEEVAYTILHDVCILELEYPMRAELDGHVVAPVAYSGFFVQLCTAVGWGQTELNSLQFQLYHKKVFAELARRRNLLIRLYYHAICKGDSGGPLICDGKIYGVASFSTTSICSIPGIDYYAFLEEEKSFLSKFVSLACEPSSTYFLYKGYESLPRILLV
ncbi:UNVERIFIED_CONTAM: hypothetical protein PYX00_002657 [Menopon gallinae]|uniref:Peptidase S1 domain-containing protein n=1 Tax=Menopon gallinae TaxID=328185 RepID=A0AAW2HWZ6_9NEOP